MTEESLIELGSSELERIINNVSSKSMKARARLGAAREGLLERKSAEQITRECYASGNYEEGIEIAMKSGMKNLAFEGYLHSKDGYAIEKAAQLFGEDPEFSERTFELYAAGYKAHDNHSSNSVCAGDAGVGWFLGAARCAEKLNEPEKAKMQYQKAYNNAAKRGYLDKMVSLAVRAGWAEETLEIAEKRDSELAAKLAEEMGQVDRAISILSKNSRFANKAARIAKRAGKEKQYLELANIYFQDCEDRWQIEGGLRDAISFCEEEGMAEKLNDYTTLGKLLSAGSRW
jgi:hypothetical protein